MPDKNNQLGWEDLEDFGKSFFQGHSDFMNKATTDFYVDPPKEEKPLTPYGQSLVDGLSEFDKLNPFDPTNLGLTPAKDGDTNSSWDAYNTGVDSMVDLTFDENIVSSVPFDNGITNTLDPRYEPPVTGTTFDGQEFTYQDTTDTYESGLIIQNATLDLGTDQGKEEDQFHIDAMNYRGDDEKMLALQKSIVSRKENGDGTVTYKFNNSPGSHMQEKLSDEAVQAQSSIASGVAALEAQILSIKNGTSFAAPGELEQLEAKLAEEKAKLIVADEEVLKEEENIIKQETDIKLIQDGETTDAEFAAAPPADPKVIAEQSEEEAEKSKAEKDKLAEELAKIDPNGKVDQQILRNQVEKVDTLFTSKSKYDWVNSIRAFYKENPEIATAIIKAASNYLQTGKWYTAAAAGLEGALLGAGTKITMDNKDAADRATLRNQGYTGASVNKFMVTKNPEDLVYDFTKKQNEYAQWLKKQVVLNGIADTEKYNKWFLELNENNQLWLEGRSTLFLNNAKGIYDKMGADGKSFAENNTAGIEPGDVMTMILDYAHQKKDGEYLLPRGPNGEYDLKQIPPEVFRDMQNIVENFSRQQYRNFQKNGKVMDTNFNFSNYYNEYKLHTSLVNNDADNNFNPIMFQSYTNNPEDGEFAGEAMMAGSSNIVDQIFQGKFDTKIDGKTMKPEKEQVWKQLAIQWGALSPEDKEVWNKAALEEDDIATTGFLFFANQLITVGEGHEWMASRNIKLFQDPNRENK